MLFFSVLQARSASVAYKCQSFYAIRVGFAVSSNLPDTLEVILRQSVDSQFVPMDVPA